MSIEIANSIHAQATVRYRDSAPGYVGQSNFGFAAFGGTVNDSQRVGVGQYRMRMLAAINMLGSGVLETPDTARGEGQYIVQVIPNPAESVGLPLVPPATRVYAVPSPANQFDILVQTQIASSAVPYQGASAFAQIAVATTQATNVYADLLTANFVSGANTSGTIDITFTATVSQSTTATEADFQFLLDGVLIGPGAAAGCACSFVTGALKQSVTMTKRVTGVLAGAHAVKVQWKTTAGTATIDPVTLTEHASLRVTEQSITEAFADADVPFQILILREPQQSTNP